MMEVFDGVWRVLRDDGVCWVNLGDSYCSTDKWGGGKSGNTGKHTVNGNEVPSWAVRQRKAPIPGLKPKDLCGLPWRVAFALQARGWYLRSAPPWVKANPMPESATDRPGTGHEMWFMLSKRARYFWDNEAARVMQKEPWRSQDKAVYHESHGPKERQGMANMMARTSHRQYHSNGRNLRTTDFFRQGLTDQIAHTEAYLAHLKAIQANGGLLQAEDGIPAALVYNSKAFRAAHFATFSAAMIRPLIQGGTSERGCCPGCGAPWKRAVKKGSLQSMSAEADKRVYPSPLTDAYDQGIRRSATHKSKHAYQNTTTGWHPTCDCYWPAIAQYQPWIDSTFQALPRTWEAWQSILHAVLESLQTGPCTVLDMFGGSGTVGAVADQLGRHAILCEAQADYVVMAQARLTEATPLLTQVETVAVEPIQQALWQADLPPLNVSSSRASGGAGRAAPRARAEHQARGVFQED